MVINDFLASIIGHQIEIDGLYAEIPRAFTYVRKLAGINWCTFETFIKMLLYGYDALEECFAPE